MVKYPYPAEAEIHIKNELSKRGISVAESSTNFKIRCPIEGCPSKPHHKKLEIRKDGRMVHCWVCDFSGTWDTLAPYLGVAGFFREQLGVNHEIAKIDMFKDLAERLQEFKNTANKKDNKLPVEELDTWLGVNNDGQPWRRLPVEFLQSLPAYAWHQETDWGTIVERIMFPFFQYGKLVGYSGRRLDKSRKLPYLNADFVPALKVFYPFDYIRKNFPNTDRIVLVEGPVDSLWLLYNKVPTFSILGTNNWSNYKRDLLVSLGIKKVLICMDPDAAGQKAIGDIYEALEPIMRKVESLKLPNKTDPAELSDIQTQWVKNYLEEL